MSVNRDVASDILNRPRPKSSPGLRPTPTPDPFFEIADETDFRAQPEYHEWYYAQHPRDPRVPPPIVTWKHYQMGFTKTSPQVRPFANPYAPGAGQHLEPSPLDKPIETPDMIPRNLLNSSTPAQSPALPFQPPFELPPSNFMLPPASAGIPQYPNLNAGAIPFIPHPGQVNNPNSGVQTNITAGPPKQAPMPSLPPSVVVQPHGAHVPPLQPIAKQVVAPSENEKSPLKKHSSHPSALLAEFRARANNKWELADLKGHVLEFAKDQEGSRFIQRQMDTAPMEARHMVCDEVMPYSHDLTTDVFGNYVVQKSLEFGTEKQRQVIIACLKGSIMTLTLHTYGCRVVQRALEVADRASRLLIAQELKTDVIKCIHDQNGNHVLQKCIEVVPDAVGFIVEALRGNAKEIASHAYGCRVMQRLLEQCESTLKNDPLLDEILSHAKEIVRNQYGNYVVQHVLINAEPKYKTAVSDCILPDFFELACHKFASNVVEKVVLHSTDATRTHLADLWARSKCEDGSLWLVKMVTNQYGNYVVQRMFEVGNAAQRAKVGQALAEHIPHIKQYACARHIIPHIEANLPSNANISGNQGGNPPQRTRPANSAPYVQQSGGYSRGRDERGAYGSGPRRGGRGK